MFSRTFFSSVGPISSASVGTPKSYVTSSATSVPPGSETNVQVPSKRVEIAFEQLVVDAQRRVVEAVFFEPFDRRVFDQRLPARQHAVGMPLDDGHRLDVGHELRKAFLILGEFVDRARPARRSRSRWLRRARENSETFECDRRGFVERLQRRRDLRGVDDQRGFEADDALLVERPRGGDAALAAVRG